MLKKVNIRIYLLTKCKTHSEFCNYYKAYQEMHLSLFSFEKKKGPYQRTKEIFPYLLSLFLENKPVTAEKKDFFVVFYYMAAGFSSDLIKNYIDCVHSNFSSHILYSYEKPSYFTSKKLFFPLEIMKDLILCSNIYFTMIFLFQIYFF